MGESRSPEVPCPALELGANQPVCEQGLPSQLTDPAAAPAGPSRGDSGTKPRSASLSWVPLFEQRFQHCAHAWLHIPLRCWGC